MSIIRIGLGENKKYGDGWDSIFGGNSPAKKGTPPKKKPAKAAAKRPVAKKKTAKKKK